MSHALQLQALCPRLRTLDLSHNRTLKQLPSEIGQLTHLQRLVLKSCRLQRLPIELGALKFLRQLRTEDNPQLAWPPPDVCHHGDEWTIDFIRCEFDMHKSRLQAEQLQMNEQVGAARCVTCDTSVPQLEYSECGRDFGGI